MKKFWSFCALFPDLFPSSPVPTAEYQLMMFVSWLAQSLSPASVDFYLAAARSYHIDWGYSDPTQNKPRLRRVLQGIHRSHGAASPPRRPITRDILCSIHRILSLPNSGFDSLMLRNSETDLSIKKPKTEFLKKTFGYSGAVLWNSLPQDVKMAESLISFKTKVKLHLS